MSEDDLMSIGMSKNEAHKLKGVHNKYCPPNYVTKLKKLWLQTRTGKDEFLLDDEANSETGAKYFFFSSCSLKTRKKYILEGVSQNLQLINGRFLTTSGHFFGNYINIFHKTEIQTVILRCIVCLNVNWIKSYDAISS